jgi:hypothetical protein
MSKWSIYVKAYVYYEPNGEPEIDCYIIYVEAPNRQRAEKQAVIEIEEELEKILAENIDYEIEDISPVEASITAKKGIPVAAMSNLRKRKTGLPVNIWVDDAGAEREVGHDNLRIKFQTTKAHAVDEAKLLPMRIMSNPPQVPENLLKKYRGTKDFELSQSEYQMIVDWVTDNRDALISLYHDEIELEDFVRVINGATTLEQAITDMKERYKNDD